MGKTNSEVRTARTRYVFIWAPPRRANITRPELTPTSLESVDRPLVHAGRALPVEHVDQLPRILVEFELHLGFIRCIFPPEHKGKGGLPRADKRLAATHLVDAVIGSIIVTAAHLSLATGAGGDPGPRRIKVLGSCLRSSRFERRVRRGFVVQRPRCQSHETIGAWIPVFCLIRIFENSGYRRFSTP